MKFAIFAVVLFFGLISFGQEKKAQDEKPELAPEGKSQDLTSEDMGGTLTHDPFGFRSKEERLKALKKYGGDEAAEDAVLKALRWLKSKQRVDGSWGVGPDDPIMSRTDSPTALTGLALLAFLGHGETPKSKEFGATVSKAIQCLMVLSKSKKGDGYFIIGDTYQAYNHAICTFALCEAYGMTRDTEIFEAMNAAVKKIVDGQRRDGGWDYKYGNSPRRDLSVGGWNMQALNAARAASANVDGLHGAIRKAVNDVKSHWEGKTGMFTYSNEKKGGSHTLTGVGVLCLIELDGTKSAEFKGAMRYLVKNAKMEWSQCQRSTWNLYSWYYQTLSFFKSEQNWKEWNSEMKKILVANQEGDGYWEAKDWNGGIEGQIYSTTLCTLMLEVYYRYFNVSTEKELKGGGGGGGSGKSDGEDDKKKEDQPEDKLPGYKGIDY